MSQRDGLPLVAYEHARHALNRRDNVAGLRYVTRFININVSELVIAHGKRATGERVQRFAEWPGPNSEKPRVSQYLVQHYWTMYRDVAVFAHDPDAAAVPARAFE